jgi:hypothetical protein
MENLTDEEKTKIQIALDMVPKCIFDSNKRMTFLYLGHTFIAKHSRKKVKNKRAFKLFKKLLSHYGQILYSSLPVNSKLEVICDNTNNSEVDRRTGRINMDIRINVIPNITEIPVEAVTNSEDLDVTC